MGALPLRNLSRVWGYLNSLELPVWARPAGFKVYAAIFGCNLDEVEKDLKKAKERLEEEREEMRKEKNAADDLMLSSFEAVAQLTSEVEQLRAQLVRRAHFLKEGGSWLFAVYDDSE